MTTRPDGAVVLRVTTPTGRRKRLVHRGVREDGTPETPSQHRRRAEAILRAFVAEVATNPAPAERWTVAKYATERYLPSIVERTKPKTQHSYAAELRLFVLPHVGSIPIDRLTVDHVDQLDRTLTDKGYSLVVRRKARGCLGRVLRHAVSKGRVAHNVTVDADRLAKDDHDRTKGTLQPEQVRALLTAAQGTEWAAAVCLLGLLGLRRGELLGVTWESIDLDAGTLRVDRSMTSIEGRYMLGPPKTAGSRRSLQMQPRLVSVLRAHRTRQVQHQLAAGEHWTPTMIDDDGTPVTLVLTDEAGRPLPAHRINDAVDRIATTARVGHVNPHLLRHSAASLMLAEGLDLAAVGAVLGHASPAVTLSVYAHALERTRTAATDSIAAAVGEW